MAWNFWKKRGLRNVLSERPAESAPPCVATEKVSYPAGTAANPCLTCGACCAFFLVSFPTHELDQFDGGNVPSVLTGRKAEHLSFMKGTETRKPRCIALDGFIGSKVKCTIYDNRPSTCIAFCRSWENNVGNLLCNRARVAYGMHEFSQY